MKAERYYSITRITMKASMIFFIAQQDYTKKLISVEFEISSDYDDYINEYFLKIKNDDDDRYDMLTTEIPNFSFIILIIA